MKKICLMSGAVINAGDFLLEKRSKELINHFVPDSDITVLNRVNQDYSDRIDLLNSFDAILFSGGPLYQPGLYRNSIPFVKPNLINEVKSPVFFLGGGLYQNYYTCSYSDIDKLFYNQGIHNGSFLGCRDIFTVKYLNHVGCSAELTGCPAWYDLKHVDQRDFRKQPGEIKSICVSDPGDSQNISMMKGLIGHLRKKYSDATIKLIIHRGVPKEMADVIPVLKDKMGVETVRITGSADGFSLYDDCDLHVGFRVHAHIYNLSQRNLSVLFNEDIRGVGVNTSLGLDNINVENRPFRRKKIWGRYYLIRYDEGYNMENAAGWMFDEYMERIIKNNFQQYRNAFALMNSHFDNMNHFFDLFNSSI